MAQESEFHILGAYQRRASGQDEETAAVATARHDADENSTEEVHEEAAAEQEERPTSSGSQDDRLECSYTWYEYKYPDGAIGPQEQTHYYYNKATLESTWVEPADKYWLVDPATGTTDQVAGLQEPGTAEARRKAENPRFTYGYNPDVHGSYDSSAPYAKWMTEVYFPAQQKQKELAAVAKKTFAQDTPAHVYADLAKYTTQTPYGAPGPYSNPSQYSAPGQYADPGPYSVSGQYADPNFYSRTPGGNFGEAQESNTIGDTNVHEQYVATMGFNRGSGSAQQAHLGPERHTDAAKSARQMNAYFDPEAAANAHDGRSLKAERQEKKLSKEDVAEFKKRRHEKKQKKRRAWLTS